MNQIYKNTIEVLKNSFNDEGEGIISFPNGLVISDSEVQRNGTRYDIDSLDISKYAGQLTADHEDKLQNIIGRVEGVKKNGGKVTVDRIVYAVKENPLAKLAYDLLRGGFSKAFSTETMGISNTADGTLSNHELVGLSQVVVPNNYAACINCVKNSLKEAKTNGLDVSSLEEEILNGETEMEKTINEAEATKEEAVVEEVEATETPEVEVAEETIEVENKADKKEEVEETEVEEVIETPEEKAEKAEDEPKEEVEDEKKKNEAEEVETGEVEKTENEISDEEVKELFEKLDNLTEMVAGFTTPEVEGVVVEEDLKNSVEEKETNNKETENMSSDEIKNAVADVIKNYF